MEDTPRSIPIPPAGRLEAVGETSETVFTWDYEVRREALLNLYEKGKRLQWNASTDIDWSIDVDPERFPDFLSADVVNTLLSPPRKLEEKEFVRLRVHQLGWMLSQFLHGEQGALLATAQIVNTVPWLEAKFYAASQVIDEARHVEVYRRYLTEKLPFALGRDLPRHADHGGGARARGLRHDALHEPARASVAADHERRHA